MLRKLTAVKLEYPKCLAILGKSDLNMVKNMSIEFKIDRSANLYFAPTSMIHSITIEQYF